MNLFPCLHAAFYYYLYLYFSLTILGKQFSLRWLHLSGSATLPSGKILDWWLYTTWCCLFINAYIYPTIMDQANLCHPSRLQPLTTDEILVVGEDTHVSPTIYIVKSDEWIITINFKI